MQSYVFALLCALLVLSVLDPIKCKKFGSSRGGSHSYPSSHGLSGSSHRHPSSSGSHGYPSSGGLSGSGGSHGYPSSGGLSGSGGSHGYPSSGGSRYPSSGGYPSSGNHGYPSGGLSGGGTGYPSGGKPASYPSSGHSYPSSGHSYPSSGGGLSGSGSANKPRYPPRIIRPMTHHQYTYNPPARITYAPPGQAQRSYPVYHGVPPTYVYKYKNSGSKYGTLLAGLALLNLGALAGTVYASRHSQRTYKPQPGEVCMFAVKKITGFYEETKIDCELITSFIWAEEDKLAKANNGTINTTNSTIVTTVTNVTVVNTTNMNPPLASMPPPTMPPVTPPPNVLYQMLPNGTLVPVNVTQPDAGMPNATLPNATLPNGAFPNATNPVPANGTTTSMTVTTTTTNTTVVNALDVKGKEVMVTAGMQCFVIRKTPTSNMRRPVPCGLLQSYARQSLKPNSAIRNIPTFTLLFAIAAIVLY
ncbi:hypothetical protein ACJJTC_006589 [Scirpophaga incertulas]